MIPMLEMAHRDLQRFTRVKYFWWRRCIFVGIIIVTFLVAIYDKSPSNSALGHKIISTTTMALFFLIVTLGPVSSAHTILEEIEKKTLGLLVITDLSYTNVVLGKYLERLFLVLLNSFAILPIFFCAISLGGISAGQIIALWITLQSTLLLAVAMGVLASTICSSTMKAPSYAFVFMIIALIPYFGVSPVGVMNEIIIQGITDNAYVLLCLYFALTLASLLFCIAVLPGKLHRSTEAPVAVKVKRSIRKALDKRQMKKEKQSKGVKAKVVGKNIEGNPVLWRDYHILHASQGTTAMRYLVVVIVFIFLFLIVNSATYGRRNASFWGGIFATNFFIFLLVSVLSSVSCAMNSFAKEMSMKAWQLLLTTPLTNKEIVFAKAKAILKTIFPYTFATVISGFFALLFLQLRSRELAITFSWVVWGSGYAFSLFSVAFFCSFYYRTYRRASNFFAVYFLVWHFFSALFIDSYSRTTDGLVAANYIFAAIHFIIGFCAITYIIRNLRKRIIFE